MSTRFRDLLPTSWYQRTLSPTCREEFVQGSGAVGPGFDAIAVLEVIEPLALVGTPIPAGEDAEAFGSLIDPLPLVDIARYVSQPALAVGLVIDEIALEAASILASGVKQSSLMPKPCFRAGFSFLEAHVAGRGLIFILSGMPCQT